MSEPLYVGVDVGGTRLRAALGSGQGAIVRRADAFTQRQEGTGPVIERIRALVKEAIGDATVTAIGVGAPGPVDTSTGLMYKPPNFTDEDVPFKSLLEDSLGLPVYVHNDANAAALGEWFFGGHGNTKNLFYMTVSTGIGGGIISQGELIDGFNHTAGEIGHTQIDPLGPDCRCGHRGCLEAIASGTNIARTAREGLRSGLASTMLDLAAGDVEKVTTEIVVEAAQRGDKLAGDIFRHAAEAIGVAVTNAVLMLSPEVVVIGGGVSQAGDLLFEPVRARVKDTPMDYPGRNVRVVPAGLGVDSGLIGAVALARMMHERATK